jgi:hypothetical protein
MNIGVFVVLLMVLLLAVLPLRRSTRDLFSDETHIHIETPTVRSTNCTLLASGGGTTAHLKGLEIKASVGTLTAIAT